ncbi:MAG: DUF58 domain-containing protein [Mariniblastus sp.]
MNSTPQKYGRKKTRRTRVAENKLTPEGWVFIVVLCFITVGALLRNVNLLILMAGMMYAPLMLNWRLGVVRLKSLHAARRYPNRIHANELTNVQWTCENNGRSMAAWNLVVNDTIERVPEAGQTMQHFDAESARDSESWFTRLFGEITKRLSQKNKNESVARVKLGFVRVDAGDQEVKNYRTYFAQRGKYYIGPAELSTTFPFGLIVSRRHYRYRETFFVAPETGKLNPTWEKRVQSIASGSESIKRQRALEEDEFHALRRWRSGDSKKNIHWRTSAKLGEPIVKQHDQQNNRDFALMIDLYCDKENEQLATRCELALSFAATAIFQMGIAVQGQIAIGVAGEETEICHSRSQKGIINDAMQRLSVAKYSDDPQVAEILFQLSGLVSKGTPIYIVSSRTCPSYLDPSFDAEDAGTLSGGSQTIDHQSAKLHRRFRQIIPLVRWIQADDALFNQMFTMEPNVVHESSLQKFSSKWTSHARR